MGSKKITRDIDGLKLQLDTCTDERETAAFIRVIPKGDMTYLWVGGEKCYGHVGGATALRRFANEILESLDAANHRKLKGAPDGR